MGAKAGLLMYADGDAAEPVRRLHRYRVGGPADPVTQSGRTGSTGP
ncbi:hypothetical protein [Nocardiopsis sp. CC223A]|nr:hypothetical protein [Nocardiopsis sp. CC223A]